MDFNFASTSSSRAGGGSEFDEVAPSLKFVVVGLHTEIFKPRIFFKATS
jgi:hypothetical protein